MRLYPRVSGVVEAFPTGVDEREGKEGITPHFDFDLCVQAENGEVDRACVEGDRPDDVGAVPEFPACEGVGAGGPEFRRDVHVEESRVRAVQGKPPELEASGGDGVPLAVPLAYGEGGEGVGGLVGDADEEFPAVRVRAFDGERPGSCHVHPAQQVAGGVRPACPCDDHGRVSRRDVVSVRSAPQVGQGGRR